MTAAPRRPVDVPRVHNLEWGADFPEDWLALLPSWRALALWLADVARWLLILAVVLVPVAVAVNLVIGALR